MTKRRFRDLFFKLRRTSHYRLLAVAGVPIRAHVSLVLIVVAAVLVAVFDFGIVLTGALAFVSSLLVHELGHLLAARSLGYSVTGVWLYPFHGTCVYDLHDDATSREAVLIALAGPFAQLALAIPLLVYYEVFHPDSPYAVAVVALAGSLGVITALFNLVPIAGLDGSVVWRAVKEGRSRRHVVRRARPLESTASPEDVVVEALDRFRRKR